MFEDIKESLAMIGCMGYFVLYSIGTLSYLLLIHAQNRLAYNL